MLFLREIDLVKMECRGKKVKESRESCSTEFCTHTYLYFTTALPRLAKKEAAVWLEKMNGKNIFGLLKESVVTVALYS